MLEDNGKQTKQYYNYHITAEELKILIKYVRQHSEFKYEIIILLMAFRGLRPQEALAINLLDFNKDFSKLSFREAKTNKLRLNEYIVNPLAQRIAIYVKMNAFRLTDGYLFPDYKKRVKKGQLMPFMSSQSLSQWFSSLRYRIGKENETFNEKYIFKTKTGQIQYRYRISPYSLRRFFETYFYISNNFNLALLKEIMVYSSRFDPTRSYIKIVHREDQRNDILRKTFTPITNNFIDGQKNLADFET